MAAAAAAVAALASYRIGLPVMRAASARSARVASALPTAPAERPRSLAISPGVCGPRRAASHSATWRRSWPLPRRPFGAGAGIAGAVIENTSGKNEGGNCGRARFAMTQAINYRGISPGISRVRNDAISPFPRQSTPFRPGIADFIANFPAFHHSLPLN